MPPEQSLSGAGRAAILLMAMGEEEAAAVLKHMNPREVQSLGIAMTEINNVSQSQLGEVLEAFATSVRDQSSLGLGSKEYLKNVLTRALGQERAGSVMPHLMTSPDSRGLETLKWMAPRDIADVLSEEHPQVIALTLLHLEQETASEVLATLSDSVRTDVIMRIANMDGIHPTALKELDEVLERQLSGNPDLTMANMGGKESAAKLMAGLPKSMERSIIEFLSESQPELVEELESMLFNFESLAPIDDRSFQLLLREVQSDTLVLALKGASKEMSDKVFKNMSGRAADLLRDDLDAKGPVRVSEVEGAQKEILEVARKLANDGQLMLPGGDEDFV